MPRQFRPRRDLNLDRMFETRSDAWEKVGLSFEVNERVVKKAQRQALGFLILLIAVYVGSHLLLDESHTPDCVKTGGCPASTAPVSLLRKWGLASLATPVRILAFTAVVGLGWGPARAIGRVVGPTL